MVLNILVRLLLQPCFQFYYIALCVRDHIPQYVNSSSMSQNICTRILIFLLDRILKYPSEIYQKIFLRTQLLSLPEKNLLCSLSQIPWNSPLVLRQARYNKGFLATGMIQSKQTEFSVQEAVNVPLRTEQPTEATVHISLLPIHCLTPKLCLNQRTAVNPRPSTGDAKLTCLLFANQDHTLITPFCDTWIRFYLLPCERILIVDHPKEIRLSIKFRVILNTINWEIKFSKLEWFVEKTKERMLTFPNKYQYPTNVTTIS